MRSFKDWLRIKLKDFLDIGNLESNFKDHEIFNSIRFSDIESDAHDKTSYLRKLINNNANDISHCQESVNVLRNTIENVVHIGTDAVANPNYGRSWSVICIEGKMNIVKFVDLDRRDSMEVLRFLKQFEAGKHCIDAPYKEFFDEGMFTF